MGLTVESRNDTPSLPHVCVHSYTAVVMCGVMETVVSGAMCSGSTDMPLWVYVLIGKSRKMKGSRLPRSASSVSPTAQRKDCLNLALCSASWVAPRRPRMNCEMGSCFVKQFSGRSYSWEKAFFIWRACELNLNKSGGRGQNALFNFLVHYAGLQKCALVYFISSSGSRWPSGPRGLTCRAPRHVWVIENQPLMLNVSLNTGWMFPYVASWFFFVFFNIWWWWVMWPFVEVQQHADFTHLLGHLALLTRSHPSLFRSLLTTCSFPLASVIPRGLFLFVSFLFLLPHLSWCV